MPRNGEFSVGRNVAVPLAAEGAAQYAREVGLVRPNRFDNVVVNTPQAKLLHVSIKKHRHLTLKQCHITRQWLKKQNVNTTS